MHFKPIPELTPAQVERFWQRVDCSDPNGCWPWIRRRAFASYGSFYIDKRHAKNGQYLSHRIAYTLAYGAIPHGCLLRHTCDNRQCCRPDHLIAGTHLENTQDMLDRGRHYSMPNAPGRIDGPGHARGQDNAKAILNEVIVCEIRARYVAGGETFQTLATEYGVCAATIKAVISGRTWKHVPMPESMPSYRRLKGTANPKAKLTEGDVFAIRQAFQPRHGIYAALARRYRVAPNTIRHIVSGDIWTHLL